MKRAWFIISRRLLAGLLAGLLAWQFARCEMRASSARFRIFLISLMLGVASIGAVGSVADSMRAGIAKNARALLGGDIELSSLHIPPHDRLLEYAHIIGKRSDIIEMRAMLAPHDRPPAPNKTQDKTQRKLVELKAVDSLYPLIGELVLTPDIGLDVALADGGAVVAPALLRALDLEIGDKAQLGDTTITINAVIEQEPDQGISFIGFGPRVMISLDTLKISGLQTEGAFITYTSRFIGNGGDGGGALSSVVASLKAEMQNSYVHLRTPKEAGSGFDRFVDRTSLFLMLVGLTALLIGGLGVSGAVRAWLVSRMTIIATLKCLGASSPFIFTLYMMQIMVIASLGICAGVILAALTPLATAGLFAQFLNLPLSIAIYPKPLLLAASFGVLTVLAFSLWPLSKIRHIKAAHLFRALLTIPSGMPSLWAIVGVGLCVMGLVGLALIGTKNILLSLGFMIGALGTLGVLAMVGEVVVRGLKRIKPPHYIPAQIALSALTRAGSPLRAIIIAFGLGLSVLVAIMLSQHNLINQLDSRSQAEAPDWFFIDIQPQQIDGFVDLIDSISPDTRLEKTPMLRGRVTALKNIPVSQLDRQTNSEWILDGDRALTWQAKPHAETQIAQGTWWAKDYNGPPLMSITQDMARDFDLNIGDKVTMNILGRDITAEIANMRQVTWESFRINFVFVISPGVLDQAPHSWIATTKSPSQQSASQIEKQVTAQFNNISAVSVKQAVATAHKVISLLGSAIQLTAFVTLLSGLAVLAGTVANSEAQRFSDAVILKTLGATRRDIVLAWLIEYSGLGLITGLIACLIGSLASFALISGFIGAEFMLNAVAGLTAFVGAAICVGLGLIGAMRTLGLRVGPYLRETNS